MRRMLLLFVMLISFEGIAREEVREAPNITVVVTLLIVRGFLIMDIGGLAYLVRY